MCKEMLVLPVYTVANKKIIIGKREGQGGGEAQGFVDSPPPSHKKYSIA
jgi:hypothetical protein